MNKLYIENDRKALAEIKKELIEPLLEEINQLFEECSYRTPFCELSTNEKTDYLCRLNEIQIQKFELIEAYPILANMCISEQKEYVKAYIGKENVRSHQYRGDSLPLLDDRQLIPRVVYSGRGLPIPLAYWLSFASNADILYQYASHKSDKECTPAFSELPVGFKAAYIALLIRSFCIARQHEVQEFVYGGDFPTTNEIDIQGVVNHRNVRGGYYIHIRGMAPSNETLLNIGHRIRNEIEPSRVLYAEASSNREIAFWKEEPRRRSKRESTERMLVYIEGLEKKPDGRRKNHPSWEDVRIELEKMGIHYTDSETLKNSYYSAKKRRETETR